MFALSENIFGQDGASRDTATKEVIYRKSDASDLPTMRLSVSGKIYTAMITAEGDTLILADLDDINVTSFRKFDSDDDYKKYMKFRKY